MPFDESSSTKKQGHRFSKIAFDHQITLRNADNQDKEANEETDNQTSSLQASHSEDAHLSLEENIEGHDNNLDGDKLSKSPKTYPA